ncbi:class A beta-lactamase-related serine hydrolase [Microbispora triticiradicis]|uniref:Class A beta-lactamase-related serine hydrolase n=1 Tax=Microbispora triticiradicis TaxID=2200763 RepID=A0ABX9LD26_9ACTN|nr:serine hydrolase domain-containing protein [Microbispora triticiradicis]RGA01883.1 class A beta-lactamase-related serine hydrolase [Microbispora triticiradicis]GLW22427.1 hypothetical protein Mame01_24700 [Microbispora amethystogenes]
MITSLRRAVTPILTAAAVLVSAPLPAGALAGTRAAARAGVQDRIDAALHQWMTANGVSNAGLAVMRDNALVGSYGYNEISAEKPVNVASLSKPITAVCLMSLIDNGRLRFDTRLAAMPRSFRLRLGYRASRTARNITIEQLLRHTSGITYDPTQSGLVGVRNASYSDVTLARRALARPISAKHDEVYNNINYAILGLVIQSVTGQPYESYCRRMALAPRGATGRIGPGTRAMKAFGGWEISAVDYAMFARAFDPRARLLSPAAHRFIDASAVSGRPAASLGVFVVPTAHGRNVFHHGNWQSRATRPNAFSSFFAMWDNGISVVVTYDRNLTDAARVALDNALRQAAYS